MGGLNRVQHSETDHENVSIWVIKVYENSCA